MNIRVISLRSLLMSLIGMLVVVALMFAVGDLLQSLSMYRKALLLDERNRAADHCLQAVKNFGFERGRSNAVLQGQYPISTQNRRFIDERRQLTDAHLGEALAGLPDVLRVEGDAVRKAWEKVRVLRPMLDSHFSLQYNERDMTLADQWLFDANELMVDLDRMLNGISTASAEVDAGFERVSSLRVLVLQFRDLVGSESTLFATELSAGRVPNPDLIGSVKLLRGRSVQLWSQIKAGVIGLSDENAAAAVGKIDMALFGRLRPYQDRMIDEAGRNGRAPITLNSYLSASVSVLDSTIELADSVNLAAAAYSRDRLDAAKRQGVVSLISIAAILILAGLVVMLLLRRFTRPLNEILQRIDKLIDRQAMTQHVALPTLGGDEFEKVGQALTLLDESVEARSRSEAALNESERINSSILACTPQAIIVTAIDGFITVFSPGAETMLGYSLEEIVGKFTPLLFHDHGEIALRAKELSEQLGFVVEPDFNALIAMTRITSRPDEREWTYIRKDGKRIRVLLVVTYLRNAQGEISGCLCIASDITERSRMVHQMSRLAYYDHLTHLPNRRLLHDRIQVALNLARRDQSRLALMLIDLDKFKPINDNYGHAVGDLLLKAAAQRMHRCLRESDTLARIGGDEFVVVLNRIGGEFDAVGVAEKIRLALGTPFELPDGIVADIACSIGVALYPEHGWNEKVLLRKADEAMYRAKEGGRNRVHVCSEPVTHGKVEVGDMPIMRLVWHRSYRCGEVSIDREHQTLFQRANALIEVSLSEAGDNPEQLLSALDQLIHCIVEHFRNEEEILARHQFADLGEHTLQHRKLTARALELRRAAHAGSVSLGDLVSFLLKDIISIHMLKEDRKFFPLLRAAQKHESTEEVVGVHEHEDVHGKT